MFETFLGAFSGTLFAAGFLLAGAGLTWWWAGRKSPRREVDTPEA